MPFFTGVATRCFGVLAAKPSAAASYRCCRRASLSFRRFLRIFPTKDLLMSERGVLPSPQGASFSSAGMGSKERHAGRWRVHFAGLWAHWLPYAQ